MDTAEMVLIVVAVILAIGVVYLMIVARQQQKLASEMNQQFRRMDTALNQPLQRLYRARDLVYKVHETEVIMFSHNVFEEDSSPETIHVFAEFSAYMSELRGLAFVIDDREFLEIINKPSSLNADDIQGLDAASRFERMEAISRRRSQALHRRIYQLLDEAARKSG